jgi:hypothetical protein
MRTIIAVLLLGLLPQETPIAKAEKALVKNPDDPAANLTLGVHYADRAMWDLALPRLGKAKSAEIRAAVESERKLDGNQFTAVEVGDAWARALTKAGPARQACFDRMNFHYAAAWPKMDSFGRVTLRERLGKLYAPAVPGRPSQEPIAGWGGVAGAAARVEVVGQMVHSGGLALKFVPKDKTKGTLAHSQAVPVQPGKKLEVSAWVLSDGTDGAADSLTFVVRDGKNGFSWTSGANVRADLPVWVRIAGETTVPEGSVTVEVQVSFGSKSGALFVDDISVRSDGKELLAAGTFEPR